MKKIKIGLVAVNIIFIIILVVFLFDTEAFKQKVSSEPILEEKILGDNITNLSKIDKGLLKVVNQYKNGENKYEEEIINNDPSQPYKLVKEQIGNYQSYLLIVYDPSNVKLMVSPGFNTGNNSGLERIINMTKRYGAIAGINGGGFFDNGQISMDIPQGYIIKDGKVLWGNETRVGNLIGFSYDNKLTLVSKTAKEAIKDGMRDAVEFGPFLKVDGTLTKEAIAMKERRASRVVIAQREDGIVLMLVTEGSSFTGPKMGDIISLLENYGAYNMANLDGGVSSQLVIGDTLYNDPITTIGTRVKNGRPVVNGWGIFSS